MTNSQEQENAKSLKAPDVSTRTFGGILVYDGAGHYPGLELLNFVYNTVSDTLLPTEDKPPIRHQAHDFARMLVWGEELFESHPKKDSVLFDTDTEIAIRRLLECLQLEIPSTTKRPTWERAHFFPYTRSLIHWDARKKKGGRDISIERRYLRGGGALAFHVLRKDPDIDRLKLNRDGFEHLFEITNDGALEQLVSVLAEHSYRDVEEKIDDIEPQSLLVNDDLEDLYRAGVANILSHTEMASVTRIRSLLRWTAFWLVLLQHRRAARKLGREGSFLILDCASRYAQLRRFSQRCLKEKMSLIVESIEKASEELNGTLPEKGKNAIRSFFWASAATVGLLNSWRGRRHFTLGIGMIETLVMAATASGEDTTFENFLDDHLFGDCNLVIGRNSADRAGILSAIDASVFEDNENHLARQMSAAGFLTEYSDATRMVGMTNDL